MSACSNRATLRSVAHWKTKNGEEHRALGEYYDSVIDTLDRFVEMHQGGAGLVGEVGGEVENTTKMINDDIIWLTKHREQIAKNIPALENVLDELTGMHMTTLYKLENLR